MILSDSSHVLTSEYVLMNSGRWDGVPVCESDHYKHSLIPLSITLVNGQPLQGRQKRNRRSKKTQFPLITVCLYACKETGVL